MTARPIPVLRLSVVESTQTAVFGLAAQGAPDRTVVVADHQSAGRGRRGRSWNDAPGSSLLASILVRPRMAPALLATFSIATAVAVAEALRRATGVEARLKWPNDVLARGRKLAGILVESRITSGAEPPRPSGRPPTVDAALAAPVTMVIGVGVNLAQRAFPAELADRATSVAIETGRVPDRDSVLEAVLQEFDAWRWRLESQGFGQVRERWLALSESIGRRVRVEAVTGLAVGLDIDGALLVDDGRGVQRIVAGEIASEGEHAARR
jgi:BirA family transcriptional regulator, biotin operon repressor / biotin---[acetyl-CoA-carboxylase] ligase